MTKVIIHNQAIIDGLMKCNKATTVMNNSYTDEELKAVSKFFDDWLKDVYIYGSDAIDVIGGIISE